jgi:hypothetical protein
MLNIDPRQRMIDETSAFLNWALAEDRGLPRIPRKRVDEGGFAELLAVPGARVLIRRWWNRVLTDLELRR